MSHGMFFWEKFLRCPVIGIMRSLSREDVIEILPRFEEAGLTTVEITMDTPNAELLIRYALERYENRLNVGAGTVCNLSDLKRAMEIGAQFIVTPILDDEVIRACVEAKLPVFPGAYTPSEIYRAWSLGASMIKVFPAVSLGPSYIKELGGPLKDIKLLPTGGISRANARQFLNAGAAGLGVGSGLFDKDLIRKKDWDGLYQHFEEFIKELSAQSKLEKV